MALSCPSLFLLRYPNRELLIIVERVDDIPVVYGMLERMGIKEHVDSGVNVHGNWIGLSPGWVITIWLVHILHEQNHLMEPVQKWVEEHKWTLRACNY